MISARVTTATANVDDANFSAVNAILEEAERDYKNSQTTEIITEEARILQEKSTTLRKKNSLTQAEESSPRTSTTTTQEVLTTLRGTSTEESEDSRVTTVNTHIRDIQN